ncbi:MAG: glycoside hydrolase family 16 protein [Fimbriimonas sp.]|nr:glycoside hydrolase family 16 protein [Fimbriimonas sp.]
MIFLHSILAAALLTQSSPMAGRHLVFDSDFTKAKTISSKDWKFDDGPVYNNEAEKYASGPGDNAFLTKKGLVIQALNKGGKYTSTRLQSVKAWKYGYFEAEVQVPPGNGTWPAFWMLNDRLRNPGGQPVGWPKCGEIDIMENVGFDIKNFHFSLHCEDFNWTKPKQRTKVVASDNPLEFHKFGLDWRPASIAFYMDGKNVYEVKRDVDTFNAWPFRDPFYIILNLAIGGWWGGAKGIDPKIFPSKYIVKYVKVYQ